MRNYQTINKNTYIKPYKEYKPKEQFYIKDTWPIELSPCILKIEHGFYIYYIHVLYSIKINKYRTYNYSVKCDIFKIIDNDLPNTWKWMSSSRDEDQFDVPKIHRIGYISQNQMYCYSNCKISEIDYIKELLLINMEDASNEPWWTKS
jgi:hypothetical protein